jgi:glutathione S-transferase
MKILNSFGPNPRMLRMFLTEKNLKMDMVEHDLLAGENHESAYLNKNPCGQMPALELGDGTVLAETVVICDYLEELYPTPALIGTNAQEIAEARYLRRQSPNYTRPKKQAV